MENKICETIEKFGIERLSDEQLLSVLVRADKAKKLLTPPDESLFSSNKQGIRRLAGQDFYGLRYMESSLSRTEIFRIAAVIELSRRLSLASACESEHVTSPGKAAETLMPLLRYETHEKFIVLLLNTRNRIIKIQQIAEGSLTSAVVHPREVFAPAVTAHASCILVAHNHPGNAGESCDPYPSTEDRKLTHALEEAGNILGIPLLDHIVIGDGRYYSFKEHGDL